MGRLYNNNDNNNLCVNNGFTEQFYLEIGIGLTKNNILIEASSALGKFWSRFYLCHLNIPTCNVNNLIFREDQELYKP